MSLWKYHKTHPDPNSLRIFVWFMFQKKKKFHSDYLGYQTSAKISIANERGLSWKIKLYWYLNIFFSASFFITFLIVLRFRTRNRLRLFLTRPFEIILVKSRRLCLKHSLHTWDRKRKRDETWRNSIHSRRLERAPVPRFNYSTLSSCRDIHRADIKERRALLVRVRRSRKFLSNARWNVAYVNRNEKGITKMRHLII